MKPGPVETGSAVRPAYVITASDRRPIALFMIANGDAAAWPVTLTVGIAGDPWHFLAFTMEEWDAFVDYFVQHRKGAP